MSPSAYSQQTTEDILDTGIEIADRFEAEPCSADGKSRSRPWQHGNRAPRRHEAARHAARRYRVVARRSISIRGIGQ